MVHIHAEGPAFFCWIPKLFGKRVISTIHGLDWAREKWKFGVGSKFIRQGEKNAVKYADEIIVLSKGVQKYFMETYGRETHFIPNGVNRPEVREAKLITDHFGLEKDSYILFLGRLVPEKGIRYLVEAFKNVKTDKKLVIAGGSSDTDSFMEELKELAKGDDRILFTGFVQGAIAGLAFEKAYAAFICNLGLGMIFAEYICHKSHKYIIQSLIVMVALMMTGKRTLFIIPIAVLLIYVILFSKNNKFIKLAGVGLGITIFIIGAYVLVPGASLIINRIVNSEGDVLSGREVFWNYAMEMFRQNPLFRIFYFGKIQSIAYC